MSDTAYLSAVDLIEGFRAKRLSPVDAVSAALGRIEAHDPKLNAFCHVDGDAAMAAARASEARWMRAEPVGRLDGVPISIKDTIPVAGWPWRRGSRTSAADEQASEDAPAVERLKAHGAVLLGKTNTPEYGWKGVTDSALFGITRNPWNPELTPGGSSGGGAAAVAAGMGPLALGTDGGGSIRIPCSFSGLFGIKGTHGRVPVYPPSPFSSLANTGPIARTAADGALMFSVLKGWDARDWYALPDDGVGEMAVLESGVRGLKIAFSATLGYADVDPEVADLVAGAARAFAGSGAEVVDTDPDIADPTPIFWAHWCTGAAGLVRMFTPEQVALMEPGLVETARLGAEFAVMDLVEAGTARVSLGMTLNQFLTQYDLLLTPTLAVPPFAVGQLTPNGDEEIDWMAWTPFTYPFNLTRHPAATVPCGFTAAGLPVGLQIIGPLYGEALVFRAARAFEAVHPWAERHPPL